MPLEQTITIINNSGKIISTGKHLINIYKEAKSAYKEKKETLKQERAGNFRRAQTFNVSRSGGDYGPPQPIYEDVDNGTENNEFEDFYHSHQRRLGQAPTARFLEGSRHPRAPSASSPRHTHVSRSINRSGNLSSRLQLTERNLQAHSEASSIAASSTTSRPSSHKPHRPYLTTVPSRDNVASQHALDQPPAPPLPFVSAGAAGTDNYSTTPVSTPRLSMLVSRPRSDPSLRYRNQSSSRDVLPRPTDLYLAYGSIPPDLASRTDLGPTGSGEPNGNDRHRQEEQAKTLVSRVEALLNEAHCIHHTAASIIAHLQHNPEAAAAVALTLAELSALLAKASPAFLGFVQGGSPAVFALLASPQFLIGTGIAVGVTVVIFGGWKIIKRIAEAKTDRDEGNQAFESAAANASQQQQQQPQCVSSEPRPDPHCYRLPPGIAGKSATLVSDHIDEALVLERELSSIESWRRGVVLPMSDGSSEVDAELISPEAMRSRIGEDDQHTMRSARTHFNKWSHSNSSMGSSGGHRHRSQSHSHSIYSTSGRKKKDVDMEAVPKRTSSRSFSAGRESGDRKAGRSLNPSQTRDRQRGQHRDNKTRNPSDPDLATENRSSNSNLGNTRPRSSETQVEESDKDKKTAGGGGMLRQLFKKKREKEDTKY